MKQHNKKIIYLLVLFIGFFVGINSVNAEAISCYYKLPFVGINSSGTYVKGDSFNCTYGSTIDCSINATVPASRSDYDCEREGANKKRYEWYQTIRKWNSTQDLVLYATNTSGSDYNCSNIDCATNSDGMYITTSTTECPRFLILKNSSSDSNKVWLKGLLDSDNGEDCVTTLFARDNHYMSPASLHKAVTDKETIGGGLIPNGNENLSKASFESKMYIISDSESDFKSYLKNFSENDSKYAGVYVPLFNSTKNKSGNKDFDNIQANLKAYRDVVSNSWKSELSNYESKLKSSCGNDWYQYINIKNYKSSYSTSQKFIAYGKQDYNSSGLASYDSKISKSCWNTRKNFFDMFESFGIFMYSIGANTDSSTDDQEPFYRSFTSSDASEAAATNWVKMEYFFKAVKNGVDTAPEGYKSDNERVQTKADSEKAVNTCKEELEGMKKSATSNAAAIAEKQAECDALQEQDNKLASENTYQYSGSTVDDIKIDWKSKKYEPKCEDVKVFTWAWTAITILAPFLLIIFASFDYFKAVMGADEEKIKKAKKKAPLRLIALLLFIITPILIKVLLTQAGTNRANNITYMICILTGDYGDSSSTKSNNSNSKKSDTNNNTKNNTDNNTNNNTKNNTDNNTNNNTDNNTNNNTNNNTKNNTKNNTTNETKKNDKANESSTDTKKSNEDTNTDDFLKNRM